MIGRVLAAGAVALCCSTAGLAQQSCSLPVGRPVMLRAPEIDPDVLVWDSKQRALDYAAGTWGTARDVMNHTLLAKPGTRALVIQCEAGVVHTKYTPSAQDVVGIRVLNGPNRGRYGWVTSREVHILTAQG